MTGGVRWEPPAGGDLPEVQWQPPTGEALVADMRAAIASSDRRALARLLPQLAAEILTTEVEIALMEELTEEE